MTEPLPPWWTPRDQAICDDYAAWESGVISIEQANLDRCACRMCEHWHSTDGMIGMCMMPVTPATVNCGVTYALNGCEQWEPRVRLNKEPL